MANRKDPTTYLVTDLYKLMYEDITKDMDDDDFFEISKIKLMRDNLKERNLKAGAWKRKINSDIKKAEKQKDKKKVKELKNRLNNPPDEFKKIDLSFIDKEIKRLKGEEVNFKINDRFNKPYYISKSKFLKEKNVGAFVLSKMIKGIQEEIKQTKKSLKEEQDEKEIYLKQRSLEGLERLLNVAKYNIAVLKSETKEFEEEFDPADLDADLKYPIMIDYFAGQVTIFT